MQGDELMLHMSESIKERRKLAGYKSVKSLCDQLTDVNSKAYYEYESGRTAIPIHIAVEVADVFGCTLDELIGRRASETPAAPLTDEKIELLDCYDELDQTGKQLVLSVAKFAAATQKTKGHKESGHEDVR